MSFSQRQTLRSIASTVKDKKVVVIYGATEAEPISIITAKEKMELEESKPDGLCVGKPAIEGSVKIIRVSDGTLYTYTCTVYTYTFTLILFVIDSRL